MEYPIVIRPLTEDEGGGFMAYFPDLPGCMSDGETPEEALKNARLAFAEWMDTAKAREGFVVPAPGERSRYYAAERKAIYDAFIALEKRTDAIDDELCELRARIDEFQEHIEHYATWDRVGEIIGSSPVVAVTSRTRRLITHQ